MITQVEFSLSAQTRGFHLVTDEVLANIESLPETGIFTLFIQHTSAGLTINENADATVRTDFESSFNHIVKENEPFYKHTYEGSDDMPAHIKAAMMPVSLSIPVLQGKLALGTWQGIYLFEHRNAPHHRKVVAHLA